MKFKAQMEKLADQEQFDVELRRYPMQIDYTCRAAFVRGFEAASELYEGPEFVGPYRAATWDELVKQCEALEADNKRMRKALEKYADGTAFDFDRTVRGEVNFNGGLSSAIARAALDQPATEMGEG